MLCELVKPRIYIHQRHQQSIKDNPPNSHSGELKRDSRHVKATGRQRGSQPAGARVRRGAPTPQGGGADRKTQGLALGWWKMRLHFKNLFPKRSLTVLHKAHLAKFPTQYGRLSGVQTHPRCLHKLWLLRGWSPAGVDSRAHREIIGRARAYS